MTRFSSIVAALALAQPALAQPAAEPSPPEAETSSPPAAPSPPEAPAPEPSPPPSQPAPPAAGPAAGPAATPTASPTAPRARPPARSADPAPSPLDAAAGPPRGPPTDRQAEAGALEVARAFVAALAGGDVDGVVRQCSDRFSFDGDVQTGRDAVRRSWRAVLAGRAGPPPRVGAVEVLTAAEAAGRLGKPPARLASLARPGVLVALCDVGGRQVALFLAREGGRLAVVGMHD